jgi:uncharacterized protein (DUF1015 family)
MATIKPIRAMRYTEKAGELSTCVCPPYDIVSDGEYNALCAENPHNLIRLELPKGGEERYRNAGDLLNQWLTEGILAKEEQPGIYLYRETFTVEGKTYSFDGLVCLVELVPFAEKVVLPHEETLSKAKTDRFNLMCATGCNFSSVYSLYRDKEGTVRDIVKASEALPVLAEFTDGEGVTHTLRKIADPDTVTRLVNAFADKQLFIADGHHRYETALNFKNHLAENGNPNSWEADSILMTLVDLEDDGLVVLPTHRLIRDLPVDKDAFLAKASTYFTDTEYPDVTKAKEVLDTYKTKHAFGLYTGGEGFTLLVGNEKADALAVEGRSAAYADLDVTVLHTLLLEGVLGIDRENMAKQINLRYTRDEKEAVASVRNGDSTAAFLLNATSVEEIRAVAEAGDKMPQKSTYFYPKLKTGLVMNKM